jgi:hypothetical protein
MNIRKILKKTKETEIPKVNKVSAAHPACLDESIEPKAFSPSRLMWERERRNFLVPFDF